MNEVVEVKRLAQDEQSATESVTCFQLGVLSLLHNELIIAKITEGAAAVGLPRNADEVADRQVVGLDVFALHLVGTAVLADVFDETVPIFETEKAGEDLERAVACFVGTVNIPRGVSVWRC